MSLLIVSLYSLPQILNKPYSTSPFVIFHFIIFSFIQGCQRVREGRELFSDRRGEYEGEIRNVFIIELILL